MIDLSRFTAGQCALPHDSQRMNVLVFLIVIYASAVSFVLLRTWSKFQTKMFSHEDYCIIAAIVLATAPMACSIYSE